MARKTSPAIMPRRDGPMLRLAGGLLVLAALLLPLKFAAMVGIPEVASMFSADPIVLAIITWPPLLFPLYAGVLALTAAGAGGAAEACRSRGGAIYAWLWLALLLASLPGAIKASTWDFVLIQIVHLLGLTALTWSSWLVLARAPHWRGPLQAAIVVGVLLTVALGVQQYFSGFDQTLEYMQAAQSYNSNQGVIEALIKSQRVFATFALPNSLAGYLILAAPVVLYWLWQGCGRVDPPGVTRLLVCTPAMAAVLFVLAVTASRAAMLAAVVAAGMLFLLLPFPRRWRLAAAMTAALTVAAGGVYFYLSRRGIHSFEARVDYYVVSLKLLWRDPWVGTGWGDFFHDYMVMKTLPHNEAPHTPHSFPLAFAGQAGVVGLLAALAVLLYPLWRGVRSSRRHFGTAAGLEPALLLLGLLAWTLHSLTDVNLEVPASTGTAILLALLLLLPIDESTSVPEPGRETVNPLLRTGRRSRLAVVVIAVLLGAAAAFGSWRLERAEYAFARLSEACEPTGMPGEGGRKPVSPEEVSSLLRDAVDVMPYSPFPWATASRYMHAAGDLTAAESFINEAIKRSPLRSAFYYRRAVIELQLGKLAESAASQRRACELFPQNRQYREPLTISGPVRE